jgi:hypothetical protein
LAHVVSRDSSQDRVGPRRLPLPLPLSLLWRASQAPSKRSAQDAVAAAERTQHHLVI